MQCMASKCNQNDGSVKSCYIFNYCDSNSYRRHNSRSQKAEEQAAQSNLEQHFGNIALSLEDVSQIADYIVMNDSLSKVQESLSAFGELDVIRESMERASRQ